MSGAFDINDARVALAGSYVLGQLDVADRAAFEAKLAGDAALVALVRDWEQRLAPLADLVPAEVPPATLWPRIAAAAGIAGGAGSAPAGVIDFTAELARREAAHARSIGRWRLATAMSGAIAAGFAAFALLGPLKSPVLPKGERFVGIVNTGGAMPALVVTVDTRLGELSVRPLGPAPQLGHSHELWAVRGTAAPVSLGLVDASGQRALKALPADAIADPALVLAVSVEPAGGSPTGKPTGPVVYTGKLMKVE